MKHKKQYEKVDIKKFSDLEKENYLTQIVTEYYGAAEPPVRCGESHLSGLTEPLRSL